ncbi:uncharacterized protein LOC143543492 [Bidens hawaiensis]|uniref:uncharacterized protein LOC143543492 n=1 Tax=Bidens hawaiensis TaxID=980011 RepID=UPI00404AE9A9
MDTTTHDHHVSTNGYITTTTTNIIKTTKTKPLSSKLKCIKKKKIGGKKDKQSKIHTAQGLRDRRMRLSVHTARKFFDLNDMLGFDKASKTIEWLFSKSEKAISEVTETLQTQAAAQTVSRENNINDESSRIMVKNNIPSVDFHPSQFGFQEINPDDDDHNMKDQPLCYPVEYSNTYHFLKHLHLDNINTSISSTNDHSIFDYTKSIADQPPACWLSSRNPLNGNKYNNNMSSSFLNFHSENQGQ